MPHLIIMKDKTAFTTRWYSYENCWSDDVFCVIYGGSITFDGVNWQAIVNSDTINFEYIDEVTQKDEP